MVRSVESVGFDLTPSNIYMQVAKMHAGFATSYSRSKLKRKTTIKLLNLLQPVTQIGQLKEILNSYASPNANLYMYLI